jgi:hypothetical protein
MKIDNEPLAAKVRLLYMGIPLIIVIVTGAFYLVGNSRDFKWLVIGASALLVFFIFMALFSFNYVSLFVGPEKIVMRYKSLSPLRTPNNAIEIKSKEFAGYEINRSLAGIRKNIILYKMTPGGKAKFPKVAINLLSSSEVEKAKQALDLVMTLQKEKS